MKTISLSAGYDGKVIVGDVNVEVVGGECILLAGANGSGKSTLMRTIAGIQSPVSGRIEDGDGIVMVPTRIPKVKGFTLNEFISTAMYRESDWRGRLGKEETKALKDAIARLGLESLADREISSLSDGEFQKGCIAGAIARRSRLILLDEPTAFLDVDNRVSVLKTLREITQDKETSIIFSSHDISDSMRVCTRVWGVTSDKKLSDSGKDASQEGKNAVIKSCFDNFLLN